MAQGDAHTAKEIVGSDAVGIPFRDGIGGLAKLIGLTIGEGEGLVIVFHLQLSLSLHPIDSLIVQHPSIVLEKSPIPSGDIDQHRGEAIASRSALAPQGGLRTSCIAMATATGIAGINRTQTSSVAMATGAHIIIKPIAPNESAGITTTHPRSFCVVGNGGVKEYRCRSSRQGIAGRDGHVRHVQPLLIRAGSCPEEQQS